MTTATKRSVCTVDGCAEPPIGRGWCQTHYYRWKRTGSTDTTDKRYLLDADTLAALRQKVGLPEDGPTPEMVKSWRAEEGIDDGEPDEPEPEPEPVDVEQQLRTEVQHVREAFDILLRERDQLARQVAESAEGEEASTRVVALERELKLVRSERGQLQRRRDDARTERDRMAAKLDTEQRQRVTLAQQLFDAHGDRHRLAGLLEEAAARIDEMQRQVEDVIATAEQLTTATAEALKPAPHRHAWEWQPGLKAMPLPCACGLHWPRNRPPGVP